MVTFVENDEILFRRVDYKPDDNYWQTDPQTGELVVTHSAFRDSSKKPSVDRAKMCGNNPARTQKDDYRNGVVSLIALDVRTKATAVTEQNPSPQHTVDIIHVPEDDNDAHSQIETDPLLKNDKAFKRFRVSLAALANERGWVIQPLGYRD